MVQRFGAVKKNDGSLITALQHADDEGTDSDGDCVPDIDELREKPPTDPDTRPAQGKKCAVPALPPVLKTGCTVSSHTRTEFVTALYCVCLVVLVCRRTDARFVRRKLVRGRTT
jgi:hypothetical protein